MAQQKDLSQRSRKIAVIVSNKVAEVMRREHELKTIANREISAAGVLKDLENHKKALEDQERVLKRHMKGEARLGGSELTEVRAEKAKLNDIIELHKKRLRQILGEFNQIEELAKESVKITGEINRLQREIAVFVIEAEEILKEEAWNPHAMTITTMYKKYKKFHQE